MIRDIIILVLPITNSKLLLIDPVVLVHFKLVVLEGHSRGVNWPFIER